MRRPLKWRMVEVDARSDKPRGMTIYADIYEGKTKLAARIIFTEATKLVQAHNKLVTDPA